MVRSRFVLVALLPTIACAYGVTSVNLGESWTRVEFEPREFYGPLNVIEFRHGALRFNKVQLSETEVVNEIRKEAGLVPRPGVYLRFSRSDYARVGPLAKEIHDTGACDDGPCMFKVTGS